jgi:trk system potassium uptake protein
LNIVIIGAGDVGYDLGGMLSGEKHDVTVLDKQQTALERCSNRFDILPVEGSGTSVSDLLRAGVGKADLVVAATDVDEVNMVASLLSKRIGARMVIARLRNEEHNQENGIVKPSDFGIDVVINPERSVSGEIVNLIRRAGASDLVSLAGNRITVIGIRVEPGSVLVGKTLRELASWNSDVNFRIVAIFRRGLTIIPFGNDKFQGNDQIFILAKTEDIEKIIVISGHRGNKISRIMIAGGSLVGKYLAHDLSKENRDLSIKLIEPDYDTAYKLAADLKGILVLHGDPTDLNLLVTEGLLDTDVFIAVSSDEESNIISCLMAKHLKVSKTVAMVSKSDYIPLSQTIGLDAAVNKKLAAANEIHRYVRKGKVLAVSALHGIQAELLELSPSPGRKITGKPVSKLSLPKGAVIGAILRGDHVEIAMGESVINSGDRVIVFCLPNAIDKVTDLFH